MKATHAEIQIRINTIFDMVVKGISRKNIVRYCAENFKIESRQVDEYLSRVYDEIKETYSKEDKEKLISKQMAQLDDLYLKSYNNEDYRECRSIIESRSKLLGLNAPDKTDVTSNGKEISNALTPELVTKLIDKL
jgi:hypothetical protein